MKEQLEPIYGGDGGDGGDTSVDLPSPFSSDVLEIRRAVASMSCISLGIGRAYSISEGGSGAGEGNGNGSFKTWSKPAGMLSFVGTIPVQSVRRKRS